MVVRPPKHTGGSDFHVVSNQEELDQVVGSIPDCYISKLIDKKAEYRVFLTQGKVINVSQKIPIDPLKPIWNVTTGNCEFITIRWSEWPMDVVEQSMKAFTLSQLDFAAVDVIVGVDDKVYVLEVNSAPALPLLSDGSISYRMKCLAKAIDYIISTDSKAPLPTPYVNSWKDVIHPAICGS